MGQHGSKAKGIDYTELAEGTEQFREVIGAMVAGLVVDGFTDREARALVAGLWASNIKHDKTGDTDE